MARLLVFGIAAGPLHAEYKHSDLRYCFAFEKDLPYRVGPLCVDGTVTVRYVSATNQLSGSYLFKMKDGSTREGTFEATYCPKEDH